MAMTSRSPPGDDDRPDFDPENLRLDPASIAPLGAETAISAGRRRERGAQFVLGPIPWAWVVRVDALVPKCLAAALAFRLKA